MKSFRESRKEAGLTQTEICELTKIYQVTLANIETGKHNPGMTTRKQLQMLFPEKINWLDVPHLNIHPAKPAASWNDCENRFRRFLKAFKSLPIKEQQIFKKMVLRHLKDALH